MTSPSIPTKHEQGTKAAPVDLEAMVMLWNGDSECRAKALELADRNRETARSERK